MRASGLPLETFLRERLFTPLGMKDTSFSVPAEKLDRFPAAYQADPETGKLHLDEEAGNGEWSEPPAFPDAGGGLVSTVDDCFAFGRMMLHKGKYDDERVLSRASVEAMTTDQLTPKQKAVSGFYPGNFDNRSWGFGRVPRFLDLGVPGHRRLNGGIPDSAVIREPTGTEL